MASDECQNGDGADGGAPSQSSRREGLSSQEVQLSTGSQVDSPCSNDGRENIQGCTTAIRASMQQVLDSWWTSRACRREMEEALERLSSLESAVQQLLRPSVPDEKSSLEELREELQVGKTKSVSLSRRWLVETFIEANPESAVPHSRRSSVSEAVSAMSGTVSSGRLADEDASLSVEARLTNVDTEAAHLFEHIGMLDFDAVAYAQLPGMKGHLLQGLFKAAVKQQSLLEKVEQQGNLAHSEADFNKALFAFLGKMEEMYSPLLPYHTAIHAADVMMTMEWFLRAPALAEQVSDLDHVMVLIACAIHDVGHPGRNNLFHTKTMSPLAVTYNDKSVLENMPVASAFQAMVKDARYNWLSQLRSNFLPDGAQKSVNLQQYVRRGVIDIVLGTDMTKHNQHQKALNSRLAARDNPSQTEAVGEALELLEAVVHAADISNPCKPKAMMLYWTQRVVDEFWAQGDEEMRLYIEVSPMCSRAAGENSIPKQQLGFIDFVIAPYYTPLAQLLPEVEEATKNMAENRSFWAAKEEEQVHYSDLFKENVAVLT